MERRPIGADLHLSATRLARTGDVIAGMKAIAAAPDIEALAASVDDTGGVYLIPIEDLPVRREGHLRVEPTRNSQVKRIRPAAGYEICNVALSGALRASAGA